MKLKYYLRGLGVGILFATIIMAIAFSSRLTDKEVEKRARDMGMVYSEETSRKLVQQSQDDQSESGSKDETTSTDAPTKDSQIKDTDNELSSDANDKSEKETTSKKEETTEKKETKAATKKTTTKAKEKETKKKEETTKKPEEKKTFQISPGMSSNVLAENLERLGIIKNAGEFNSYLETNGYASRLVVGDYSISGSVSYETLAKLVTN